MAILPLSWGAGRAALGRRVVVHAGPQRAGELRAGAARAHSEAAGRGDREEARGADVQGRARGHGGDRQGQAPDATADAERIVAWWRRWPDANIGAVVPDGFVVIDVDVTDLTTVFGNDELPAPATAKTGRGRHLVYRTSTLIRPKVGVRAHVDLRGPGSYIVVAPSLFSRY